MARTVELQDSEGDPVFVVPQWVGGVFKGYASEGESSQVLIGSYSMTVRGAPKEVAAKIFGERS